MLDTAAYLVTLITKITKDKTKQENTKIVLIPSHSS